MQTESEISSKDNSEIKLLKKLALKKYRYETGLFIVENATIIKDASRSGRLFRSIFTTDEWRQKNTEDYQQIRVKNKAADFFSISEQLNKFFSSLDTPSGICAIYEMIERPLDSEKPCVYLNAINDPGNLGTIMRTMLAFGFHNLVVDENCADLYNPKTISAAKDAIFKVNVLRDKECEWLKNAKESMPIYVSDVQIGKDLDSFKAAKNYCLVLGSESHGVSDQIKDISEEKLNIRISEEIESLNVGIAAAIFLYKLSR